jgi:hypothetical protein
MRPCTVIAGTIGWEYVMRPILTDSGGDSFGAAVALGYPLLDLAILTVLVVTLYAAGGRYSPLALVLTGAAAFQIVSDSAYTFVLTRTGSDNVGIPMELGWLAAYLLIAVCFSRPNAGDRRRPGAPQVLPSVWRCPRLGVPLLALLLHSAVQGHPSPVLLSGAIAAISLIVSRQAFTLQDSFALLVRAANSDDLTQLPNRRRFEEEAKRHVAQARRRQAKGAVLLLGLDDLKAVNDGPLGRRRRLDGRGQRARSEPTPRTTSPG